MKITWFGTASVALESGGTKILFDPFLRLNKKLAPLTPEDFAGYDAILLTHGHMDHLLHVPQVLEADKNVTVYCTAAPKKTLMKKGVGEDRIALIAPGDTLTFGDISVRVRQGHHVLFDPAYIGRSFPKCLPHIPTALWMISTGVTMPERGQIVIYEITCEGKTVLLMGSYGTVRTEDYAKPDVWIFPYNGSTRIPKLAERDICALQPKTILFDHYDDAFPPLTQRMDTERYAVRLQAEHPEIRTVIPTEREPMEF